MNGKLNMKEFCMSKYKFLWFILLSITFLYITPLPAAAGTESDTLRVFESRDSVLVVADRLKLSLPEIAYTYQIIDKEAIQLLSQHSALELVDAVYPSAYILEKGVMGYGVGQAGAGNINIRGQGGRPNTGMLVLINGHPDFMGLFGHPLPDVYGTDDIQQIEILSGPASTLFGSQAMAGVINIRSMPDFTAPVKISASAGSYSSYNIGFNLNRHFNQHGFSLTVRQRATDGHIAKTSSKTLHLQTGWYYTISPAWQLSLEGRYVPFEFDDPSRIESKDQLGIYGKIRRGMAGINLKNDQGKFQGSTQVFTNLGHHRFYDGFESHDFSWGASSYQQWKASSKLNLAGGGEFIRYGGKANVQDQKFREDTFGIYLLGFYTLSPLLNLKGGLRYQYSSLNLQQVTPQAGIALNILPNVQVYANYQSGFRYPTINELYLFQYSNPYLKAEEINSVEGGFMYYWPSQDHIRITVFRNNVNNLITPPPAPMTNSGAAKQWGMEVESQYTMTSWLSGQVGISLMDPGRLTAFNPQTQLKYQFHLHRAWFSAICYGKYVEKIFVENDSHLQLPDYHLLNLVLNATYSKWSLNVQLLNILDRKYIAFKYPPYLALADYRAPGFHFMTGLTYSLF